MAPIADNEHVAQLPAHSSAGGNARLFGGFCLAILATLLAASCASPGPAQPAAGERSVLHSGAFTVSILDGSIYRSADFSLVSSESGGNDILEVHTGNARDLKGLYLEIRYDATLHRPIDSSSAGILSSTGTPLVLTVNSSPGCIAHGELLAGWPEAEGFSGSGPVASFVFSRNGGKDVGMSRRASAGAPDSDLAEQYLSYSVLDGMLGWYYSNPGDYDQNGLVSISDLTPLGIHFGKTGPFDTASALSVVDGDGNDLISISDVTPIGANFGRQVDSYAVYGSPDAGDYPAGNTAANGPGTRRLGTVPLSAASGGASDRLHFDFAMDSPIVGGRYWVRPAFSGQVGTPSRLTSPYQQSWHLQEILGYGPNPLASASADLAVVNGRPAILSFQQDGVQPTTTVRYWRAADSLGSQWDPPVELGVLGNSVSYISLAEVNGRPAFSWYDDGSFRVNFRTAADPDGTSWNNSITVYNGVSFLSLLTEHDGKPVVGYKIGSKFNLSPSLDAEGGTWLPGVQQYEPVGQWNQETDIISLSGGIGTATEDLNSGALMYVFAAVNGTDIVPGPPVTIFPGNLGFNLSLAIGSASGMPFVVTRRSPSEKLYFSYAQDPVGTAWGEPDITGLAGSSQHFNATGAYGVPWVAYYDDVTGKLHSGHAVEPQSGQWANAGTIIEIPPAGSIAISGISMAQAGIHPAVCFNHRSGDRIVFAAFY